MNREPLVSVIIPCRNEKKYIRNLLENIIAQDYNKEQMEVFIADGLSDDGTTDIIESYVHKYPYIHYLKNEKKIVPGALNSAIQKSSGDIIIRMDAHSEYPVDYIRKLVYYLITLKADNVGGVWITQPSDHSLTSIAIAKATSSSFGIGNALYRTGAKEIKQVDTVPFGCYPKEVFTKIGLFDEELIRNQDDEFNARLIQNGGKIFLIPEIKITYFSRESISKMNLMFFQYGLFKPLVNKKIRKPATIRQFIPVLFVLYLISIPFLLLIFPLWFVLFPLFLYLLLSIIFSLKITVENPRKAIIFVMPYIFLNIHISYGFGYLQGIFRFTLLKQKKNNNQIKLSR